MLSALPKFRLRWPFVVVGVLYLYLGFHVLTGDFGYFTLKGYEQKIQGLEIELAHSKSQRVALETSADQLRASQLDLDALDIQARQTLNVSQANEFVIWLDQGR